MKQTLTELKGETDSNTLIEDFNFWLLMDRTSNKITKETEELNNTVDEKGLTHIETVQSNSNRMHILKYTRTFYRTNHDRSQN